MCIEKHILLKKKEKSLQWTKPESTTMNQSKKDSPWQGNTLTLINKFKKLFLDKKSSGCSSQ